MDKPPAIEFAGKGIDWQDSFATGYSVIDDTHHEFVTGLDRLLCCADSELSAELDLMLAHLDEHFKSEADMMQRTAFPATDCHIEEHDAVMKSARQVKVLLDQGDFGSVRGFALALRDWFPGHVTYLDSALAAWVVKKERGGRPVVLHFGSTRHEGKHHRSGRSADKARTEN